MIRDSIEKLLNCRNELRLKWSYSPLFYLAINQVLTTVWLIWMTGQVVRFSVLTSKSEREVLFYLPLAALPETFLLH